MAKDEIFTKELNEAIDSIVKLQTFKSPQSKLCLLWLLKDAKSTELVCFRKIPQNQLQITSTTDRREFEEVINSSDNFKHKWDNVTAPEKVAKKLLPLLANTFLEEPTKEEDFSLSRLYAPHFRFWNRYIESWRNGNNQAVLLKVGNTLTSRFPILFVKDCWDKLESWIKRVP